MGDISRPPFLEARERCAPPQSLTAGPVSRTFRSQRVVADSVSVTKPQRPDVPEEWVRRVDAVLSALPGCDEDPAWTGVRWRVAGATVAHIFGGHDQRFRITFRARDDEVLAFEHMGEPYFVVGGNAVGMLLDEHTDWQEVAEMVTDSYLIQAPQRLAERVDPTLPQ